ncbi:hypothetical protein [Synechococcus sp. ROS8604]|uniref:hypothetical protein n=1 Tax=Synechococcus sp. ROS8604 TaxID=1442557 RepID=UPI0016494AA8|nr:hypothetical protein [Synechococcus sp. ROS8604]QNI88854.1 hypothetical protein SynROS8604_02224 [Synechococcus sp. ROS8604]
MRISSIATPIEQDPKLTEIKLGSSSYLGLPVQLEQTKAEKDNDKLAPVRGLYLCLPNSRQSRAVERFLTDRKNPENPGLGLKINCLVEMINAYEYQTYTGPKSDDPDPTATEVKHRIMREHFTVPGSEAVYDAIFLNGEVDVIPLDAWGKRTIITSDNSVLKKFVSQAGKHISKMTVEQFSVITKKTVWQSMLIFTNDKLVTDTVSKLPDWTVVAIEGRIQNDGTRDGLALIADTIIPIKVGKSEEVGDADSEVAEVRTGSYSQSANYGSTEDY